MNFGLDDVFRFDALPAPEVEAPQPDGLPSLEEMRRAIYCGGVYAATGELTTDGYDEVTGLASRRLDLFAEGTLAALRGALAARAARPSATFT